MAKLLVEPTEKGLWCESACVHVDPWRPVEAAVVTHGHADHATPGCGRYIASPETASILRIRYGIKAPIDELARGEFRDVGSARISLHPAGHILGSTQVRIEASGSVTVVTGDYKTDPDPTCTPFECVECDALLTESTFGLPVFKWPSDADVFDAVNRWWRGNVEQGMNSVVFAYSLGKAQRVLAGVDASIGPILVHGAVDNMLAPYHEAGIGLPETRKALVEAAKESAGRALIIAPPSAAGAPWMRKFTPCSTAFASGWMAVRGTRRWRAVDRGFVISDHADWDGLLDTVQRSGAKFVGVTHGYTRQFSRYLRDELGIDAEPVATRYSGEGESESEDEQVPSKQVPASGGAS
ncbi:MAG: ligase-associated DNA damage response exonuclease [Phycisphaerales bacterium]